MVSMPTVNIKLSDEEHAAIKSVADEKGLTLSDSVKWVVREYFNSKPKKKGLKAFLSQEKIDCEHPPSKRMHNAFGVYCDVCKEEL